MLFWFSAPVLAQLEAVVEQEAVPHGGADGVGQGKGPEARLKAQCYAARRPDVLRNGDQTPHHRDEAAEKQGRRVAYGT